MTKQEVNEMHGTDILTLLKAPFHVKDIEWRVQSATKKNNQYKVLVVPYIDARAVQNRLDEVCGAMWKNSYQRIELEAQKEALQCKVSIKIDGEWIEREDAVEIGRDNDGSMAVKGAYSNALKRAAVQWGIGRYLYDLPKFWVKLQDRGEHRVYGKFTINKKSETLSGYFDTPQLPKGALPAGAIQQPQPRDNQNQSTQQNQQQTRPSQQTNQSENREKTPYDHVSDVLKLIKVEPAHVPHLFKRVTADGQMKNLDQASDEDLRNLYKALNPVKQYIEHCRKFGLDESQMLYYAQIELKQELSVLVSLCFKMTSEIAKKTLEIIRAEHGHKYPDVPQAG